MHFAHSASVWVCPPVIYLDYPITLYIWSIEFVMIAKPSISLCRGRRHTVCSFVCLFVCHSVFYISFAAHAERWELKLSKTRHYLAFEYVKVSYEALFSSYGMIDLPWLPLLAIWTSLKSILPAVVCLAACRIGLYHKIAHQIRESCE